MKKWNDRPPRAFRWALYLTALLAAGCGRGDDAAPRAAERSGGRTDLSGASKTQGLDGVGAARVQRATVRATIARVGWLEPPPAKEVVVRAPLAGFAAASPGRAWPTLGDRAEAAAGQVRVFLSPQEVAQLVQSKEETDTTIQQSLVSMRLSEDQLKRVGTAPNAVAGVRVDELREAYERSKAAYEEAKDKLPFLIREPYEEGALVKPVAVASPLAGQVVAVHAAPGQFVQAGDPLWTVADWSTLWLRVPLFEDDFRRVDRAAPATLRGGPSETESRSAPGGESIRPLDLPTAVRQGLRTIDLPYAVDNASMLRRAGGSMTVDLPVGGAVEAWIVPASAVLYDGFGVAFVYAREGAGGAFRRKRVELGPRQGDGVAVLRGLDEDDEVAATGAQTLYAEEFKGSLAVDDDD